MCGPILGAEEASHEALIWGCFETLVVSEVLTELSLTECLERFLSGWFCADRNHELTLEQLERCLLCAVGRSEQQDEGHFVRKLKTALTCLIESTIPVSIDHFVETVELLAMTERDSFRELHRLELRTMLHMASQPGINVQRCIENHQEFCQNLPRHRSAQINSFGHQQVHDVHVSSIDSAQVTTSTNDLNMNGLQEFCSVL